MRSWPTPNPSIIIPITKAEPVSVAKSAERFWTDQQTSLVLNDAREMRTVMKGNVNGDCSKNWCDQGIVGRANIHNLHSP
jgi:hypothetical protein